MTIYSEAEAIPYTEQQLLNTGWKPVWKERTLVIQYTKTINDQLCFAARKNDHTFFYKRENQQILTITP